MSVTPNDLAVFARVVDEGSFSRAAAHLGLPKSTVSRRISALEAELGERLLLRTTRKLSVTDFGAAVLEHAQHVVHDVEAAAALAHNRQIEPSGRLRVSMPSDLANLMLAPLLADFALAYPRVTLDLDLSARFVDLFAENVDVAIRVGPLRDDASLAARRLGTMTRSLYAAPAYLARHGNPVEPEALIEHQSLHLLGRGGEATPWLLERGEQRWEGVPPSRAIANSPALLLRLALAGLGIVILDDHFALAHVEREELTQVLPDWRVASVDLWAVFPGRRLMPARTRVFLDALAAKFGGPECVEVLEEIRRARTRRSGRPEPAAKTQQPLAASSKPRRPARGKSMAPAEGRRRART